MRFDNSAPSRHDVDEPARDQSTAVKAVAVTNTPVPTWKVIVVLEIVTTNSLSQLTLMVNTWTLIYLQTFGHGAIVTTSVNVLLVEILMCTDLDCNDNIALCL